MKRILILFILIIPLIFVGCSLDDIDPIVYKEDSKYKDDLNKKNIDYDVEKISLSKSYQNIEPNIEIIKKDMNLKLLVSLGLIESSGIDVKEIKQIDNEINIHIENQKDFRKSEILNPQILIDFKNLKSKNISDLKFNIISENYENIDIKLGINEVIDKVNSSFNLSVSNFPDVNIVKRSDKLLWDISYKNIFDKYNIKNPIINLSILVDANSGDIIKSSKDLISSYIDEGEILNYINDNSILYTKTINNSKDDNIINELLTFDVNTNEIQTIYKSKKDIRSVIPNSTVDYISILESDKEDNEICILETNNNKAYKVSLDKDIKPRTISWKNNEELYIVDNKEESSNIYSYNIKENDYNLEFNLDENIVDLKVEGKFLLLTEQDADSDDLNIYLRKNGKYVFNDSGFKPTILPDGKLFYLQNDKENHTNKFKIYDLNTNKTYANVDLNVSNYFVLEDNNIVLIEKNDSDNQYTLYKYNITEKNYKFITNIKNDNVFYNKDKELLYLDHMAPFEINESQIIYSIDLKKIKD